MTLNKQEFKVLVMLYAANVDGNIQSDEVRIMLEKTDFDTVDKVEKMFDKMSDAEVITCIRENKPLYITTEGDRLEILADICAIIEADEQCTATEEFMVSAIRRLLD
ncbi:MAG: hypothetical protein K6A28_01385 [Bacteroidales bacterium]|nr:hypothetical protein [Bacteroidales bacterium]